MTEVTYYTALAVESDAAARMRLKQATKSVYKFKDVVTSSSLEEALSKLSGDKSFNVVFLTERFRESELVTFIKKAGETAQAQDAAFVLLVSTNSGGGTSTAKSLFSGFDGCLMEPYSVDALTEITDLAARVNKERSDTREMALIELLLKDIMGRVDRLAYVKSCKVNVDTALKKLRGKNGAFEFLDEEKLDIYYQVATELLGNSDPETFLKNSEKYKGVSERIKKRMAEKILTEEMKKLT